MASGPSIVVRILADLKSLTGAMDSAGTKAESTASRAHKAFSGFLSGVNQTGVLGPFAGALGMVDDAMGQLAEHSKSLGTTMLGVGGAMTGVGATLSMFGSKEQASHQQLQAAVAATGKSYDEYSGAIERAIKHNENYAQSSASTQDALRILTQATHDPAKALQLLGETTDLAASKHIDLASAANMVGRTFNGSTRLTKQYGIEIDKTTKLTKDHKTATQALAAVLSGQAAASVNTFGGHLDVLKTKVEDSVSQFGQKYGPAIQGVGIAAMALGSIWEIVGPLMASMEGLGLWPILLIIGGIVALIAAAWLLYKYWGDIWGFVKRIAIDVWDWIKNNWPLLLAILLGPIGAAAALIITHFNTIKAVVGDTVRFIVAAWNGLWAFFSGIIGAIGAIGSAVWNGIWASVSAVVGWISGAWNGLWSTLSGLFDTIKNTGSSIWNGISDGAKAVFGFVAHLWNDTLGQIHFDIPSWIPGIGGHGFGFPTIGGYEQGGYVPSTGLALLHAGETVIPKGAAPSIHIENVNLASTLDVDDFLGRAAWAMRTSAA